MEDQKKRYYKLIKKCLLDNKIKEVYYQEINYEENEEYWKLSPAIHSVDMNVILRLDDNKIVQIKWDSEFYNYGVGIEEIENIKNQIGFKTIEMTNNEKWKNLINKKIININILWDINRNAKQHSYEKGKIVLTKEFEIHVPQTWEIEFENKTKIWISAMEIMENGDAHFWDDHLTLLFDNNDQEKYELIRKANAQQRI